MTFRNRSLLTLFFIAVFAFIIYDTWGLEFQARLMPIGVSSVALFCLFVQLARELKPQMAANSDEGGMDLAFSDDEASAEGKWRTLEMFGWVFALALLLWLLGFYIAIPLIIFLYLLRQRESLVIAVTMPAITGVLVWAMFDQLATIPFPPGAIFDWLGWS